MSEEIEDIHYNICKQHDMSYLHYVIHNHNYINMSPEDIKIVFTKRLFIKF